MVLRRRIAAFIASQPSLRISDTAVREWVRWDAGCSVQTYTQRMSRGGWGGGIEMAACSLMEGVNVHVYERCRRGGQQGFQRISCFDVPNKQGSSKATLHVLYCGGVHYDALIPTSELQLRQSLRPQSHQTSNPARSGAQLRPQYPHQHQHQRWGHQQQNQNQHHRQHQQQHQNQHKKRGFQQGSNGFNHHKRQKGGFNNQRRGQGAGSHRW